jgi:uncharacterized protein YbjT (DUF2867 family)
MTEKQLIVVCGATGKQGGAVVKALLSNGNKFRIRGVSRNIDTEKAAALKSRGVELVKARFEDRESMRNALKGAYGVFSVQNFFDAGYEGEIQQGKIVAELCKELGIRHLVYSSVGGADRDSHNVRHFHSKWMIEEHIRSLGLPATILRPVFFMDNLLGFRSDIEKGVLTLNLKPTERLQMIAVDDIGFFAAMAFNAPNEWLGKAFEIAGDERTMNEYAQILGCKYQEAPLEKLPNEDLRAMYQWFRDSGYKANIANLRKMNPRLQTFDQWAKNVGLASKTRGEASVFG